MGNTHEGERIVYTEIVANSKKAHGLLGEHYERFKAGIQAVLSDFGISASDAPVEPPFKKFDKQPEGIPAARFIFTTSRLKENKEIPNEETAESVCEALGVFIEKFANDLGISCEPWFQFTLTGWFEVQ